MARKKSPNVAKVENNPDLVRDMTSNAIINNNNTGFMKRRAQIAAIQSQAEIDAQQRADINSLKNDMLELKKLLKQLVGNK